MSIKSESPSPIFNAGVFTSLESDENQEKGLSTKCNLCSETYTQPKVLPCFHTFCQLCLEKLLEHPDKLSCPSCHQECVIPQPQGIAGLMSDYAFSNVLESSLINTNDLHCTGCKSLECNVVARCFDCANFLCPNCVLAHQFMHCFEGHRVLTLGELQNNKDGLKLEKPVTCARHTGELVKFFCRTCSILICNSCTNSEHPKGLHDFDYLSNIGQSQVENLIQMIEEGRMKCNDLKNTLKTIEHIASRIQVQFHKAQNDINETAQFYRSMVEERKQESLKELDAVYNSKQVAMNVYSEKLQDTVDKFHHAGDFVERQMKFSSNTEVLVFKKLLDTKLQNVMNYSSDHHNVYDVEFVSNYQAIQIGVRNTFGYIRSNEMPANQPQPIARPSSATRELIERQYQNGHSNTFDVNNLLSKRFGSMNSLGPFSVTSMDANHYERWSSGSSESSGVFSNGSSDNYLIQNDPLADLSNKFVSNLSIMPSKSQIKRQKMIYHCKFGEFGVMEGQFTEPSGVAVNAQNEIIVADTNNHRIQVFDKEGRFKFQFGECGKRDGQLLYPNRVAVVRNSGDIVVTERSPTHQIQIYNQYGQFQCKFAANILQHPRGVTVDNKGRIIVVECKVMRVLIFDQAGNILHKFGCSKHLEFPNGVVVNDKQEIFISDNRAHCVKVFNYEGAYLRQIGGEGITNYPIGVGFNQNGEILIADNHNNFNLTVFTQDGQLVSALESKVKHAQCFDVALLDDGSAVLASKDYRLYIYRYMQVPSLLM